MTRKVVKGIFFDAGDTLFEAEKPIGLYYSELAGKYGISVETTVLDRRFKAAFKEAPPLSFPGVSRKMLESLECAWWREIVVRVFEGIDFPQFDQFFTSLYQLFEEKDTWRLFPECLVVLSTLKQQGYTLGIISNFDSRLITICTALGIQEYFDVIVFSSQAGSAKPCPEIFLEALEKTNLRPEDCALVGDHPVNDVKGARNVGMFPVLIDRKRNDVKAGVCDRISSLDEIYNLFQLPEKKHPAF